MLQIHIIYIIVVLESNTQADAATSGSSVPAIVSDNSTVSSPRKTYTPSEAIIAQGEINPLYNRNYRPSLVSLVPNEVSTSNTSSHSDNNNNTNYTSTNYQRTIRSESTNDNNVDGSNNSTALSWSQKGW